MRRLRYPPEMSTSDYSHLRLLLQSPERSGFPPPDDGLYVVPFSQKPYNAAH